MKTKLVSAILCIFSFVAYGQTEDSIASTLLVADYDYTCHTSNAQDEDVDVNYGLTLQVAGDMACTMGQKRHDGEDDMTEQLLYVPTTWLNYPQGKITSVETVPPYRYLTSEKMEKKNGTLRQNTIRYAVIRVRKPQADMAADYGQYGLQGACLPAGGHGG